MHLKRFAHCSFHDLSPVSDRVVDGAPFLGTVAGDVSRQVACDVLMVLPRRDTAGTI